MAEHLDDAFKVFVERIEPLKSSTYKNLFADLLRVGLESSLKFELEEVFRKFLEFFLFISGGL